MSMRLYEMVLNKDVDGIVAVSLVDKPAIEENFIALSEQFEIQLKEVDAKRGVVMGPVLIPNMRIKRRDEQGIFEIYFSEDTVLKAAEKYLIDGNQKNVTLQHADKISGVSMVESWIIADTKKDKSAAYNLSYPKGTWMGVWKVDNQEVKDKISSGEIKGFSIEGYFSDQAQKMSLLPEYNDEFIEAFIQVLKEDNQ